MLRSVVNKKSLRIALFPFFGLTNSHDKVSNDNVSNDKVAEITPTKVNFDKVKDFFFDDEGSTTTGFQSVLNATAMGFVAGFFLGGLNKSKLVIENFIKEHEAHRFASQFEARRLMQYKIALGMFNGGISFGVKVATFCFLFCFTSEALQAYQGKFDAFNHVVAGAVTGSVYKINMGLKGAFAGCFVGTLLGSISGIATSVILYITGTNMNDITAVSSQWMHYRQKVLKEQLRSMDSETKEFMDQYNKGQTVRKIVYGTEK